MDIVIRSGLALLIISGGFALALIYQYWSRLRARKQYAGLGSLRPGISALIYFTTPSCAPCKTIQRPAIQKLSQMLGEKLQVMEIDASESPEMASRWGVLSVPTTFVIDPRGNVKHVNHGVTRTEQLLLQIQGS